MGRPKKIQDSRSRSFLLPAGLLNQIETAAQLQEKDVSDVVRDILEENIRDYCKDSDEVSRIRMREALNTVSADPRVRAIFDQFKDKDQQVIPLHTGLDKRQLLTLIAGLEAYHKLKWEKEDPPEKIKAREALDALEKAATYHEPDIGWTETVKNVRRLAALLDARDDVRITREQGEPIIEVEEFLGRLLEDSGVDLRALRSLQFLIRKNVLCPDPEWGSEDTRRYKVPPTSPYVEGGIDEDYSES